MLVLDRRRGCLGPSVAGRAAQGGGKIYHGHGARQLKQPLSSGPDEAKKKDYQPVGRDGQPIYRPVAYPDYCGNLPGVSKQIHIYL